MGKKEMGYKWPRSTTFNCLGLNEHLKGGGGRKEKRIATLGR